MFIITSAPAIASIITGPSGYHISSQIVIPISIPFNDMIRGSLPFLKYRSSSNTE